MKVSAQHRQVTEARQLEPARNLNSETARVTETTRAAKPQRRDFWQRVGGGVCISAATAGTIAAVSFVGADEITIYNRHCLLLASAIVGIVGGGMIGGGARWRARAMTAAAFAALAAFVFAGIDAKTSPFDLATNRAIVGAALLSAVTALLPTAAAKIRGAAVVWLWGLAWVLYLLFAPPPLRWDFDFGAYAFLVMWGLFGGGVLLILANVDQLIAAAEKPAQPQLAKSRFANSRRLHKIEDTEV